MTGPMIKKAALVASGLLLALPAGARERQGAHHAARHRMGPGMVVTSGSDVRITSVGEVIVPPPSIVVVNTAPLARQGQAPVRGRGPSGQN